jgi:hypothetical protein
MYRGRFKQKYLVYQTEYQISTFGIPSENLVFRLFVCGKYDSKIYLFSDRFWMTGNLVFRTEYQLMESGIPSENLVFRGDGIPLKSNPDVSGCMVMMLTHYSKQTRCTLVKLSN